MKWRDGEGNIHGPKSLQATTHNDNASKTDMIECIKGNVNEIHVV